MTAIALSTRIRLARNLSGYPFPCVIRGRIEEAKIVSLCANVFKSIGGFTVYKMQDLSPLKKRSLVERYLISKSLAESSGGAVAVDRSGLVSVMINEEDHLREQVVVRGFDLAAAYKKISYLDSLLRANLNFCREGDVYYTSCPSNLGTGMRASVMLFLPEMGKRGEIDELADIARESGLTIRGAFGEGSVGEGHLYQVSNEVTLGVTPEEVLALVKDFVSSVVSREEYLRALLKKTGGLRFENDCLRALGTLTHSVLLSYGELVGLISKIKLGLSTGVFTADNDYLLDDLLVSARSATLRLEYGEGDEDYIRAKFVRESIKKINVKQSLV